MIEGSSGERPSQDGIAPSSTIFPSPTSHENVASFIPDSSFIQEAELSISAKSDQQVPGFWVKKYEKDRARNWDTFYKNNGENFFKDRHYLEREFSLDFPLDEVCRFIELGCGVGNALLPLVESHQKIMGIGVDCSKVAIGLLNGRIKDSGLEHRCSARVVDLTEVGDTLDDLVGSADYVSLFFAISACAPESYNRVAEVVHRLLKPGGKLLFRDYAKYDLAQIRLSQKQSKLGEAFYVRGDGTRAKFFTEAEVTSIFSSMKCLTLGTHARVITNRKTNTNMKRLWIQGTWQKL